MGASAPSAGLADVAAKNASANAARPSSAAAHSGASRVDRPGDGLLHLPFFP